jgi:hypothetical protein
MPAPRIFGVEDDDFGDVPLGPGRGALYDWHFGPVRAAIAANRRSAELVADTLQLKIVDWIGVWQLDTEKHHELHRTAPGNLDEVVEALESWLKVWLAELVGALGLELRERQP